MTQVRLTTLIAPPFYPLHKKIKAGKSIALWLKGGRGSTKSSFAAIEIISGIIDDPEANAIVFRKVGDTIKDSVLATLLWAIEKLEVEHLFEHTISPARIIYKPTGQVILFKGLDKAMKLKSIKLKRGYFKWSWYEETAEFSGPEELRNVGQSIKRGGDVFIEIYSYNPPIDPQAWINDHVTKIQAQIELDPGCGKTVHHSTYYDVPPAWLGEQFLTDAAELLAENPLAHEHEYMGLAVGISEAIIFAGKYTIETFEPKPHWDGPYYGGDWGFSQDPSTLVKCWIEVLDESKPIEKAPKNLYIEYAEFGKRIELDEYEQFYDGGTFNHPTLGKRAHSGVPGVRKGKIMADCSLPATISHVKSKGFDVVGAEKWPESIEDGITVLLAFHKIIIHTRCKEMAKEARLYSFKIDRITKQVTRDIVDKFNHGWDAVRYALAKFIVRKSKGFFG